ncbi:ABC transporter permease [Halolamina sp. CBA1230]|uniref:ABC transporter permease n=1 Tax=Halolamina sp. CBA1230 TaxID=1853690 RepID=UPI0009A243C7|nr:ABC transporter permease [Halolamina sp. CBA1230]QKY20480.1 ABC transporter permease [Halolamina sp. CBA1230]
MRRALALCKLGVVQTLGRFRTAEARRLVMTLLGVALAVALMVSVTSVAVGLASGSTVQGDDVDYWIVPEGGSASSIAVSVEGPRLGAVHQTTHEIEADDRVTYATPIQLQILQVTAGNSSEYVLAAGVIPPEDDQHVIGLPTTALTTGDPHYDNGTYNGSWTGEAVLSSAAADVLGADTGTTLNASSTDHSFRAVDVAEADIGTGLGPVPVMLVHLSELQTITGTASGDQADQILVSTNDPSVERELTGIYPRTDVLTRSGVGGASLSTTSLPLAVAVAAFLTAVSIGALFVATLTGLDVIANRATIAAQGAMGFSRRSQTILVLSQVVTIAGLGGIAGTLLGVGGIFGINWASTAYLGVGNVATFHPLLLAYGPLVAIGIGLLASPYPAWLARRTNIVEVLDQ